MDIWRLNISMTVSVDTLQTLKTSYICDNIYVENVRKYTEASINLYLQVLYKQKQFFYGKFIQINF